MTKVKITLETGGDATDDLMERCARVAEKMLELTGESLGSNELSAWANALAIVAGSLFGQLHEQGGLPVEADAEVAGALPHNILQGMGMGREEARKARLH